MGDVIGFSNYHLLLIEDDSAVAQGLTTALEREGYRVSWRSRGQEGLMLARESRPQLIILDVRLPDGSGFDFCRQLRDQKITAPILMLTVQDDEVDKVLGLEMGADAYMTKPFSLRELQANVRALLRRAYGQLSPADAHHLSAGDLEINLAKNEVLRSGRPLNLTPTEYRLLVYLMQNRQIALSRAQILSEVWGYDHVESERTVNVQIRRLREKVELDPGKPQRILTVPGVGYRLV
ncbi:MAG: response regulator transcription factor [Ardenticatenaceae bacterium]|nr:response regulator transcription factor [Ardenticatenaceae bacterium]